MKVSPIFKISEGKEYDVDGPPIDNVSKYAPFGEEDVCIVLKKVYQKR